MKQLLFVITVVVFCCGVSYADNTGAKSPASSAQEVSPTTAWTNIGDVFTSNDVRAVYTGTAKDSLYVTNFTMGVPGGATITAIIVTSEGFGSSTNASRRRLQYQMTKDGTTVASGSDGVAFAHPQSTDGTDTNSGGTDSLWNVSWTAAEINATTFGVITWKTANQAGDINLDHVTVTVHYTTGGAPAVPQIIIID